MSFVDFARSRATVRTLQYAMNREHLLEYQKQWQKENHDVYIQYQKNYYQKTKEQKKEKYNMRVHCHCCKKDVRRGSLSVHCKTKKHVMAESKLLLCNTDPATKYGIADNFDDEQIVYQPFRLQ